MRRYTILFFILFGKLLYSGHPNTDISIDLMNAEFHGGILKTLDGGVIQNEDMRIQAKEISYQKTHKDGIFIHEIVAEGNLVFQYKGKIFVGNRLFFDLATKTGTIEKGKTFVSPFYLSCEKITLLKDGSIYTANTSMTTAENIDSDWGIFAKSICVTDQNLMQAKQITFRASNALGIKLPSFSINLKKRKNKPILDYQLRFDKFWPKVSVRYQAYSWEDFFVYLRGEYRFPKKDIVKTWLKGFGIAMETEYFPKNDQGYFITRNYLANDVLINDQKQKTRYRVQGLGCFSTKDKNTRLKFSWDKFSDIRMPQDYKSSDFEVNTRKKSELLVNHDSDHFRHYLYVHPKLNYFETIKQDLPTIYSRAYPIQVGSTSILSDNWAKASYLEYSYADNLDSILRDYQSIRLQTYNTLYYPIHFNNIAITPKIGGTGIFYDQSPIKGSTTLATLFYDLTAKTNMYKHYPCHKHMIEPYLSFNGILKPTKSPDDHYIFSLQDGLNELNQLKFGIKNLIYFKNTCSLFTSDLYAYNFLSKQKQKKHLPKLYLDMEWDFPSYLVSSKVAWNFIHNTLDYSNLKTAVTINENLAFTLEFRYRSKHDYRKADHENFILDVTRPEQEILLSSLSDRRITILTSLFARLNPFWSAKIESHHGFYRKNEAPYHTVKLDLFTSLSAHWKLIFSFQRSEDGYQTTIGYQLKR